MFYKNQRFYYSTANTEIPAKMIDIYFTQFTIS